MANVFEVYGYTIQNDNALNRFETVTVAARPIQR